MAARAADSVVRYLRPSANGDEIIRFASLLNFFSFFFLILTISVSELSASEFEESESEWCFLRGRSWPLSESLSSFGFLDLSLTVSDGFLKKVCCSFSCINTYNRNYYSIKI